MRFWLCLMVFFSFDLVGQLKFVDISSSLGISRVTAAREWGSGVSIEDFDNDGDLDFAISSDESSDSRIMINLGNNLFDNLSIDLPFHSRAALWVDYNGDHLLDIIFAGDCSGLEACDQTIALFQQQDNATFVDVTFDVIPRSLTDQSNSVFGGMASADINEDGFLDIILAYFDKPSTFLRSNGGMSFDRISWQYDSGSKKNWTPILFDIDMDGWVDYYQASDLNTENRFWSRKGDGNFGEIGTEIGLNNAFDDMGIALGDYDNDEDLDIYITNIYSSVFQVGNVLFENDEFTFSDQAPNLEVNDGSWGWGVTFMDGNNDGYLDIAATNGMYEYDTSRYWLNNGDKTFTEVSKEISFNDTLIATSLVAADLDRDGDLDILQTLKSAYHNNAIRFLRNDLVNDGNQNYLVVKPRMTGSNHWAIGSLVRIVTSKGVQIRPITAGVSFLSQEPAEAFFGLGELQVVDSVEIIWPGGGSTVVENINANQIIEINDDEALHPPKNLFLTSADSSVIQLVWQTSSAATSYLIERSTDSTFPTFNQVEVSGTSYSDTDFIETVDYYYRVRAKKGDEISRSSIHLKVNAVTRIDGDSPRIYQSLNRSITSTTIFWEDNTSNEDGFIIQRSGNPEFKSPQQLSVSKNVTKFTDTGLEPNAIYYYRVKAFMTNSQTQYSATFQVDLSDPILSTPDKTFEDIYIFPNPSNGILKLSDISGKLERLIISDLSGKKVSEYKAEDLASGIELNIKGVYIVTFLFNDGYLTSTKITIK